MPKSSHLGRGKVKWDLTNLKKSWSDRYQNAMLSHLGAEEDKDA